MSLVKRKLVLCPQNCPPELSDAHQGKRKEECPRFRSMCKSRNRSKDGSTPTLRFLELIKKRSINFKSLPWAKPEFVLFEQSYKSRPVN
jgi:hypothetical protein